MDLRALVLLSFFSTAVTQDVILTITSGEQCFGSRVTLLCTHPDPSNHPGMYVSDSFRWAEDGTTIEFSDPSSARFTPTRFNSTASNLSFTVTKEDYRYRLINYTCFLVFNNANRDREESNVVTMNPPPETTTSPTITSLPTNTSDVLRWTHTPNICSNYTYRYVLTWSRTDTPNNPTNGSDTVTTQEYDFSNLPRGNYTVTITAQRVDYPFVRSEPVSMSISLTRPATPTTPTDPPGGGHDSTLIIVIIVVAVVVVVLIVAIIIAFITICVCRNKPKVTQTDVEEKVPPTNPSKKDLYGQVEYTKVYISDNRPCKPPRIPDVEYTEAMEVGQKVKTPPPDPLPPKEELKMKVVAILQRRKIVHESLEPDEAVVGTYQNKTFVANFVYFEDDHWDVPEREIDEMVKMRDHQGTDKGLLVTNMETLPSNLLEKLEKQHCHFIGVGRIEQLNENALMKKFGLFFTSEK